MVLKYLQPFPKTNFISGYVSPCFLYAWVSKLYRLHVNLLKFIKNSGQINQIMLWPKHN